MDCADFGEGGSSAPRKDIRLRVCVISMFTGKFLSREDEVLLRVCCFCCCCVSEEELLRVIFELCVHSMFPFELFMDVRFSDVDLLFFFKEL